MKQKQCLTRMLNEFLQCFRCCFPLHSVERWPKPIVRLLLTLSSATSSLTLADSMSAFTASTNLLFGELAVSCPERKDIFYPTHLYIPISCPVPELNTSLKQLGVLFVGSLPTHSEQAIIISGSLLGLVSRVSGHHWESIGVRAGRWWQTNFSWHRNNNQRLKSCRDQCSSFLHRALKVTSSTRALTGVTLGAKHGVGWPSWYNGELLMESHLVHLHIKVVKKERKKLKSITIGWLGARCQGCTFLIRICFCVLITQKITFSNSYLCSVMLYASPLGTKNKYESSISS